MAPAFNGERSTTSDAIASRTNNCDLTTTSVPLVSVCRLQEGLPRDKVTFILNDKRFPTSIVEAVLLSPAIWKHHQVDACERRFVICNPQIGLQNLLSEWKMFFKSRIRDRPLSSAGNYAMSALNDFSSVSNRYLRSEAIRVS
jgi:hypothetical protein